MHGSYHTSRIDLTLKTRLTEEKNSRSPTRAREHELFYSLFEWLIPPNVSHAVDRPREVQVYHVPDNANPAERDHPGFVPRVHRHDDRYEET